MSLGIRHIEILVSDLEKSVDFYDPDGYILEVAYVNHKQFYKNKG